LTNTALFTLLANWGTEFAELTAICDPSKPLQDGHNNILFDSMVGREDRIYSDAFGKKHPITFNLSGPIQFMDSKATHGIQVADAVAAAAVHVFSGADDDQAKAWRAVLPQVARYGSIVPDLDHINLKDRRVQRNAVVLLELHERATSGTSLTDGMPDYVRLVTERLATHPMRLV